MRRSLIFPISTQHYDEPVEEAVTFNPPNELIPYLCLEFNLLLHALEDSILLFNERQTFNVQLELQEQKQMNSTFEWQDSSATLFMIRSDLEYCLDFYLEYYQKKGKMNVNHVDLQLYGHHSNVSYNVFLTFSAPETDLILGAPEEARLALGLPQKRRKKKH